MTFIFNICKLIEIDHLYYKSDMISPQRSHDRLTVIGCIFLHGNSRFYFQLKIILLPREIDLKPTSCTFRDNIKFSFSQNFIVESVPHRSAIIKIWFGDSSIWRYSCIFTYERPQPFKYTRGGNQIRSLTCLLRPQQILIDCLQTTKDLV